MAMAAKNVAETVYFYPRDAMHPLFEIRRNGIRWNETECTFDAISQSMSLRPDIHQYDILIIGTSTGSASCIHLTNMRKFLLFII